MPKIQFLIFQILRLDFKYYSILLMVFTNTDRVRDGGVGVGDDE